ncbi:MAG: EF-hand domain-containing protein, partial [Gemmataceae bacterium]|nr:EF-hand domain-containing protein [Gemmataceae bacterium]
MGLAALLLLSGAVGAVRADGPAVAPAPHVPKPKFAAPAFSDTFEVLVFTNQRPVRLRVTALQDGKSVGEVWRDRLQKAFTFCDRDADGFLSEKEIGFMFSNAGLGQLLQNGLYQPTPNSAPTLKALDADGDGKVSFEEFVAYYKVAADQLLRPQPVMPDNAQNAAVTEAVFKLLDANGDGKLTKDEVLAAEKLLATRDADEDECLSMQELVPDYFDPNRGRRLGEEELLTLQGRVRPGPESQMVVLYERGKIPGTVTQQVIKRYDRDGDFELTQKEIGFDDATFKALDVNGDGRLDGEELDAWRTGEPDLDVTLSISAKAADCSAKLADEKGAAARGFKLKQSDAGRLVLHVGRQPIDFWAFPPTQFNQAALKQQYGYLFTQAAGGKAFVEEKALNGPNAVQFQFLRVIFEAADRDADGKLTKEEFDAYFDLQDSFRNLSLSLTPAIQTPTLFQLLDENRDGRLGVRELRTAWARLIVLEEPGAEVITRNIIQPSVSLRLTRTFDRYNFGVQVNPVYYGNNGQVVVPTK